VIDRACGRWPRQWALAALLITLAPAAAAAQGSAGTVPRADDAAQGTVSAGPFTLRYRIEGTGTPVLVIGSAVFYPRVFSADLRRHLRFVFLDHRGFAPSSGAVDRSAFALDVLLDDVERAREQLGLDRVAVLGHSGHGLLALEYAKKYPAHVSHVIMVGIAPDLSAASWQQAERAFAESVDPERKAALEASMRRTPDSLLAMLPPVERWVRDYLRQGPRAWFDPHYDASPLWAGVEPNPAMFDYVWGEVLRDIDITSGLAHFDRPVFLALGRYDFVVAPPSSWDRVRPPFRDLTVRVFERSGHTPPLEEPARFDAELLRWLEEHP
jgi:proline iminopeptidase